jgi:hypothetical protein
MNNEQLYNYTKSAWDKTLESNEDIGSDWWIRLFVVNLNNEIKDQWEKRNEQQKKN